MDFLKNFNIDRFLFSLQYMWKGMFCIFVVIAVIILSIVIMNKLANRTKETKETDNQ